MISLLKPDAAETGWNPAKEFFQGVRDVIPFMVSALPTGIIFGTLAPSKGLSFLETITMSAVVYSGSAQFVGLGLLELGATWPIILLTTFILSLRMLIYSTLLVQFVRDIPAKWRLMLGFGLVDAAFFVTLERYKKDDLSIYKRWYFMGTVVALFVNWMIATVVGLLIGHALPDMSNAGLDFVMIAVFVAMIASTLANWKIWATVISAGILVMLTYRFPYNSGIVIAGLGGALVGMMCELYAGKQKGAAQ